MLTGLCLILLMTYGRFVLSALALNLQFIESPTANYSQRAAIFFFRNMHVRHMSTLNY